MSNNEKTNNVSKWGNYTFDEINVGDQKEEVRTITQDDIKAWALISGDSNPIHLDVHFARKRGMANIIAQGMWSGALISAVLGSRFPGYGTIYLKQNLQFKFPIFAGDTIRTVITATNKNPKKKIIQFDCKCINQYGRIITTGEAEVIVPLEKIINLMEKTVA